MKATSASMTVKLETQLMNLEVVINVFGTFRKKETIIQTSIVETESPSYNWKRAQ
jgi:hypothetical protein